MQVGCVKNTYVSGTEVRDVRTTSKRRREQLLKEEENNFFLKEPLLDKRRVPHFFSVTHTF
jgi:hypothetical protein